MIELSIDIETFSEIDIKSAGAYKYSEDVELILFGYSVDKGPAFCVDLTAGEMIPDDIMKAMVDKNVRKTAHNAAFERAVISQALKISLPPENWRCSAVLCAVAGYPMSLDEASKALGTAEKKDAEGKNLIRYFCIPCKPTKANGMRTRNLPHHAPDKWVKFIEYCKQDVVTEQAICTALSWVKVPELEHKIWCLDQRINERGWKVDIALAESAIFLDDIFRERLTLEAKKLTGMANPNSVSQLKDWFLEQGLDLPVVALPAGVGSHPTEGKISLSADAINDSLKRVNSGDLDYILDDVDAVRRMLEIRQEMSKTSIKKYVAMLKAVGSGDRIRGLFQFYGAGRTGRWAGRLVQVQNLPRIPDYISDVLLYARELVLQRDIDNLELCFGSLSIILSQLIRTSFKAEEGKRLIISDFSAIEARVIAWLAGEEWRLDIFRSTGKIYEASASQMFGVPVETIVKGHPNYALRAKGKVAELACGYQGGVNALIRMGALEGGLTEEELPEIIKAWRKASPAIVKFWYDLQRGAKTCIQSGETIKIGDKGISFSMRNGTLLLTLPSGRSLYYPKAGIKKYLERKPIYDEILKNGVLTKILIGSEMVEREKITFWAVDSLTRRWGESDTYGGKLCENIVQAVARDCQANAMLNLDSIGIPIVSHVHDEVVAELPLRVSSLEEVNSMMLKKADWMGDLPLGAAGDESLYYNK